MNSEETSRKNTKKASRKIKKSKRTKARGEQRNPSIRWSLTEKIQYLWANLQYAINFPSKKISWATTKPYEFYPTIIGYVQNIFQEEIRNSKQLKSRDENLKKAYYERNPGFIKIDILDHSYFMVQKYVENAKKKQIEDINLHERVERFQTTLSNYSNLENYLSKPNLLERIQHDRLIKQEVKKMIKEMLEEKESQPFVPISRRPIPILKRPVPISMSPTRGSKRLIERKYMGELSEGESDEGEKKSPEKKLLPPKQKVELPPPPRRFRYSEKEYDPDDYGVEEQVIGEEEEQMSGEEEEWESGEEGAESCNQSDEESSFSEEEVQDILWKHFQGADKGEDLKKFRERKVQLQDYSEKEDIGNKKGDIFDELLGNRQKKRDEE